MNTSATPDENSIQPLIKARRECRWSEATADWATHPAAYDAPTRNEAEKGLGLLDARLPDAGDQTVKPTESNFRATGHVQRVKAGARLR